MAINKRENKNGSIVFVADFTDANDKRYRKTFDTYAEADKWEKTQLAAVVKGEYVRPSSDKVAGLANQFLDLKRAAGLERGTLEYYRGHVDNHIVPELGEKKISVVNDYAVLRAIGAKWAKEISSRHARKVFATLAQIFELALEQKIILENIAAKRSVRPRSSDDEKKIRAVKRNEVYTLADFKKFLLATESGSMERVLVMLLGLTGMRIGEILGLTWKHVDLDEGAIDIVQSLDEPRRAGEEFRLKATKTANSERQLEKLDASLIRELKVWKIKCPVSRERYVFCSVEGRPLFHSCTWRLLERIRKRAKVERRRKRGHHIFRHVFASVALKATNRDLRQVSYWLGHADATITQQTYEHFMEDDKSATLSDLAKSIMGE